MSVVDKTYCEHYRDGLPYCAKCEARRIERLEQLQTKLAEALLEVENKQYSILCDADRIQQLCDVIDEQRAEIEQYKMGKISPADYYSMAEAETELCNEIAELKQKYSEMNEERIKWLGDNMKQAKLIEQMREAIKFSLIADEVRQSRNVCASDINNACETSRINRIAALSAAERGE